MSIATIVTRGYGSFGSIAEIVTRGYVAGAAAVVTTDTHDGGPYTRREYDEIRRRIRRVEQASKKSEEERRKAERRLVESVEKAYRRVVDGLPEDTAPVAVAELIAEAAVPTVPSDGIAAFTPDWAALALDLDAVNRLLVAMEERARDEEDVLIILLAVA